MPVGDYQALGLLEAEVQLVHQGGRGDRVVGVAGVEPACRERCARAIRRKLVVDRAVEQVRGFPIARPSAPHPGGDALHLSRLAGLRGTGHESAESSPRSQVAGRRPLAAGRAVLRHAAVAGLPFQAPNARTTPL